MNCRFWKKICANNSMEDDKQVSLTPALLNRDSESDKKQYRSVLNLARKLEEKDILNIALTGPYGSGKSSILRSLKKDYPKYKYLSISLATLKSPLDDKKNEIDIDTMNNRIEYSILQQLIYKEKQETLYNSRLKRIYHKSHWAQYALSIAIILYTIALIIVFDLVVAIEVGVVLAALLFLMRMANVTEVKSWKYIGENIDEENDPESIKLKVVPKHTLVYEVIGPMFFAAADKFMEISAETGIRVVIIRMRGVPAMDVTALRSLQMIYDRCQQKGITLLLSHVQEQPKAMMEKAGFAKKVGEENFCKNIDAALQRAESL